MTPARFADLASAYGGGLDRWPTAERDDAARFLREHPDAEALLRREDALDAALGASAVAPPPPPFLAGAIATRVTSRWTAIRRLRAWLAGGAAAAALAGGVAAGFALATLPGPRTADPALLDGLTVLGAPLPALGGATGDADPSGKADDADPSGAS